MTIAVILIRPHRGGWQCFEGEGVGPYFVEGNARESAIEYASQRMRARTGEIRVLDAAGEVERVIAFC